MAPSNSRRIIIQVLGGSPKKKGSLEEYFLNLTSHLKQEGYTNVFVFNREIEVNLAKLYDEVGAEIIIVPDVARRIDLATIGRFVRIFKKLCPDLVNFHFAGSSCFNGLVAARMSGVPSTVWTKHSFNEKGPFYRKVSRIKTLTSMIFLNGLLAKKVIAVSDGVKKELLSYHLPETKISRIYLGVNLDRFGQVSTFSEPLQDLGIKEGERIISCISQARPEKGLEYLIRALPFVAQVIPNMRLLVVGGGPLTESLQLLARSQGVAEHVLFAGVRNDVERIINASEFTVLPSESEAQGLVVLESFACGRPVVASNVGGIPEIVTNEVNGLLVPSRDVDALARGIIHLLQDGELLKSLGMAAADKAKIFDVKSGVARTVDLYQEVMGQDV
jgi:glycosyltransferase involved in cell wall biosynthesis